MRAGCSTARSEFWIAATASDDRTASDDLAYRLEALRGNYEPSPEASCH